MLLSKSFSILLLVLCTALSVLGLPKPWEQLPCARDDEDCHEQRMHPEMAPTLRRIAPDEQTAEYWLKNGIEYATEKARTAEELPRGVAKNVIFFIGDGMSLTTLAATRVYLGGEDQQLSFEKFRDTGLARTYSIDRIVTDSAATATAFLSGVKTMYGTLGVSGHVSRGDCDAILNTEYHVPTIADLALKQGKSVGLVTTARLTDATPGALYSHTADRNWESDVDVNAACGENSGVLDIAHQLIHSNVGRGLKVILGGGKRYFIDQNLYVNGRRTDGRNLIDEFLALNSSNVFVETRDALANARLDENGRLLGMFHDGDMSYAAVAPAEQPTLTEMTEKALELLSGNPRGYLLFVEGASIDKAHHATLAKLALDETAHLHDAVAAARISTNINDTLIVVSSDHSHTMSISGYAQRSNDIFALAGTGDDELPYMTLSYANGPSYYRFFSSTDNHRVHPSSAAVDEDAYSVFPATTPMTSETHGGEDVAVYASGPWSDLFSGTYEQSTLPYLISYASCMGDYRKACDR